MNVIVYTHPEFERQFKRLRKKYHSLVDDYRSFLSSIANNPLQGVSLGNGVRKVRFAISSKGKGKSGGLRIITFLVTEKDDEIYEITLLYIYDKKEMGNVSERFINSLIKEELTKER